MRSRHNDTVWPALVLNHEGSMSRSQTIEGPFNHVARWLLLVGLGVLLVSFSRVTAQEESSLRKRFLAEAPQGWKRHQEFWQTLQGTANALKRMATDGKVTTERVRYHIKQCDGRRLDQIEVWRAGSYEGAVTANNSQYSFKLTRKSPDRPWVLVSQKPGGRKVPGPPCEGLTPYARHFLPKLIQAPEFKLLDVTPEKDKGRNLVRVSYSYTKDKDPLRGGWVVLDPNHDWVMRRGQADAVEGGKKSVFTINYEYKEGTDRHLIMTKMVVREVFVDDQSLLREGTSDCEMYEQKVVPESEFMLGAYGLPEPVGEKQTGTRWYLWAAVAGLTCLTLGVGYRRLLVRR